MSDEHMKRFPWYEPHQQWLARWRTGDGRADLSGADLRGANLRGANLWCAKLTGANLIGADLTVANLRSADMWGADLIGANLLVADLTGANLRRANLTGANLRSANLTGAKLRDAELSGANLWGAIGLPDAPPVPDLHARMAEVCSRPGALNMMSWHTCETTHCRAGWAITLAGEAGAKLEAKYGASVAGALIYARAYPSERVPDFHASNEDAMEDILRCAKGAQS